MRSDGAEAFPPPKTSAMASLIAQPVLPEQGASVNWPERPSSAVHLDSWPRDYTRPVPELYVRPYTVVSTVHTLSGDISPYFSTMIPCATFLMVRSLPVPGFGAGSGGSPVSHAFDSRDSGSGYARTRRFSELAGLAPLGISFRFAAVKFIAASH